MSVIFNFVTPLLRMQIGSSADCRPGGDQFK